MAGKGARNNKRFAKQYVYCLCAYDPAPGKSYTWNECWAVRKGDIHKKPDLVCHGCGKLWRDIQNAARTVPTRGGTVPAAKAPAPESAEQKAARLKTLARERVWSIMDNENLEYALAWERAQQEVLAEENKRAGGFELSDDGLMPDSDFWQLGQKLDAAKTMLHKRKANYDRAVRKKDNTERGYNEAVDAVLYLESQIHTQNTLRATKTPCESSCHNNTNTDSSPTSTNWKDLVGKHNSTLIADDAWAILPPDVQQKIDAFRQQRAEEASKLDMENEARVQAFHTSNDGFASEIATLVNAQLTANAEFKRLMGGHESMDASEFHVSNKRRMGNQGQPIFVEMAVAKDNRSVATLPQAGKGTGVGKGRGQAPPDAVASDLEQQAGNETNENKRKQEIELERKLVLRSKELIEQGKLKFTHHTASLATDDMDTAECAGDPIK